MSYARVLLCFVALGCDAAGTYDVGTWIALREIESPRAGWRFGSSIANAGDLDGDGRDDLLIVDEFSRPGRPGAGEDESRAYFHSSRTGELLVVLKASPGVNSLMHAHGAGSLGDVDGDGRPEFWVSNMDPSRPCPWRGERCIVGRITVCDGQTREPLFELQGSEEDNECFGDSAAPCGDVDGDGVADILVGAPCQWNSYRRGRYVRIFSGKDGHTIAEVSRHRGPFTSFGRCVGGLDDVDGDGVSDFFVADPLHAPGESELLVYCGRRRTVLATIRMSMGTPHASTRRFGMNAVVIGDVDGDGSVDVALGDGERRIWIASPRCGEVVRSIEAPLGFVAIGRVVSRCGDVDGDGIDDIAFSAQHIAARASSVLVHSGRTGELLRELRGTRPLGQFGWTLCPLGDIDDDGRPELAISEPDCAPFEERGVRLPPMRERRGVVWVISL
ncbi:MAG: integrin alpha [Planctomycetota bacterium]